MTRYREIDIPDAMEPGLCLRLFVDKASRTLELWIMHEGAALHTLPIDLDRTSARELFNYLGALLHSDELVERRGVLRRG